MLEVCIHMVVSSKKNGQRQILNKGCFIKQKVSSVDGEENYSVHKQWAEDENEMTSEQAGRQVNSIHLTPGGFLTIWR